MQTETSCPPTLARRSIRVPLFAAVAIIAASATFESARATLIDFNSLVHGEVVTNQFAPALTISADNFNRKFDLAIIFDGHKTLTADPDLEGPNWSGGNLAKITDMGKFLILAENNTDADKNSILDDPDDEGERPAGEFTFSFANPIRKFGFDLVDVEGTDTENGSVSFYDQNSLIKKVQFSELTSNLSPFFDPTISFGDHTINHLQAFTAAAIGGTQFNKVVIRMGGSGGVDNVLFNQVPEPSSWLLAFSAAASALAIAWRSRSKTRGPS